MTDSTTTDTEVKNCKNEVEKSYERISSAVNNVRNRDVNRRGPFVISDNDLNDQFRIK